MRMTNEQLIDAAHNAAKYLPPASAQLMSDLATQLDVALVAVRTACAERNELETRCAALSAENAALKSFISSDCFTAQFEPETFYAEEVTRYVSADGYEPETPATDAFLAEVRTQGVSSLSNAIQSVISERQRQQSVEGWTPVHDDEHTDGQLATAASCYALMGAREQCLSDGEYQQSQKALPYLWPWDPAWWKPKGARSDLVRAGALILAEIERIDRATGIKIKGE